MNCKKLISDLAESLYDSKRRAPSVAEQKRIERAARALERLEKVSFPVLEAIDWALMRRGTFDNAN